MLTLDDVYPPATTFEELQARTLDAVDALGFEIITLDIDGDEEHITGIALYDPEQHHEVMRFDSSLFELEVLTFLRWLVTKKKPGDLEQATRAGLAALAEPFVYDLAAVWEERSGMDRWITGPACMYCKAKPDRLTLFTRPAQ